MTDGSGLVEPDEDEGIVRRLALVFSFVSGIGLVLSLVVHVAAIAGVALFGGYEFSLHFGIFIVSIPVILFGKQLTGAFQRADYWNIALRGCPAWMKYLSAGFFGYALLNFAYFLITTGGKAADPALTATLRGFSGHWMAFYSVAMAICWSRAHVSAQDAKRRCAQGHRVPPPAHFCEKCGGPVLELPSR